MKKGVDKNPEMVYSIITKGKEVKIMRTTGIIRRMDDLGRVIIPREIRREMGLREGEPLEIYTEGKDMVCFRKYKSNLIGEVDRLREQVEINFDLSYTTQARIETLLDEIRELVKGEE